MTDHLSRDLQEVKRHVLDMGALAEEALRLALSAYKNREEVPARKLRETERKINLLQLEIDDELIKILALHQPVARDLRFVAAAMRIVNDLERIGDLTNSIADRLLYAVNHAPLNESTDIERMMEGCSVMLRASLNSFVSQDSALARTVLAKDDVIDELNRRHFQILIGRMKRDPDSIDMAVALISISRGLERIADLATNIAEDVVFMVDAEDIRHPRLTSSRPQVVE
jgi:phosphate transport system protein